ncbi:hypothetical protein LSH36_235g03034 [Paralvinella palmiformis]|uniref:Uncharacterized protein n=1 Tax=Paralvinella palmiformis TaxID=53620 RepID=A0AAD9JM47_9ANNE|nr:hypothetical protein LSH36_235g03034 [Paralvinella palmiformis]
MRRPKTPPPRRPPRPVVKEKSDNSDAASELHPTTAETSSVSLRDHIEISNSMNDEHDVNLVKKNQVGKVDSISRSYATGDSQITSHFRSLAGNDKKSVIHIPLNRKKRKAPDVPRTSRLTGTGDINLCVSSQKGSQDGWRLISKSFSPADLTNKETGQCLDTLRLRKGSLDDDVLTRSKPIVQYVQIVKKDRGTDPINLKSDLPSSPSLTQSKSVDELNRFGIFLDLSDISCDYFYSEAFRSSFLEETTMKRQTIGFHSDIQTLLKHSHKDEEHIYSLPQPLSYSDNTLKAVKLITDKYDTLQRRRLHAASFREGDLAKIRGTRMIQREPSGNKDTIDDKDDKQSASPCVSQPASPLLSSPLHEEQDAEDILCQLTGLSKKDILRLEMFYKGHDTEVIVCSCLADLYLGNAAAPGSEPTDWLLYYTGVPIWVLNTGEGQRNRELHIFLAERETGFPLWRDKINYLTNLETMKDDRKILKMRLSGGLSKMAKFCVVCEEASVEFHKRYLTMTADPGDELWCMSSESSKVSQKMRKKRRKKRKSFTTHDISQPCNFQHIAKLDPTDPQILASIALLMRTNTELAKGRNSLPSSVIRQCQGLETEHLTV